jgi:hypothetical protein
MPDQSSPSRQRTARPVPTVRRRYPSDMALARQNQRDQSVNPGRPLPGRPGGPEGRDSPYARPAAQASRNCRFMTLPLALRGSGCAVRSMVSGTL